MNKIALITGANKGIGLETARQLGKKGYTVLIGARNESLGTAAAEQLKSESIDAIFVPIDPTNFESIQNAVKIVTDKFGKLDVLINNAGSGNEGDNANASLVSTKALRETFDINVFGLHEVTRSFWDLLNKSEAARLVNVSSILGSLEMNSTDALGYHPLAYNTSKAAVNMMTIHYALEWRGTPHKANTIHPGNVKTDLNPHGQIDVVEGAKTSVDLATIGADGPNGGYFHLGKTLPW